MNNNRKVSIIMPVYNAQKTLNRCLDALLKQTYRDFEVICINDGSNDNSLKILENYAKNDNRIKVYSQRNSGVATARHNAINYSSGKYIMFCDSDDWYEPDMIKIMIKTIEEQNVDLVECNCNEINLGLMSDKEYGQYSRVNGFKEVNSKTIPLIAYVLWNKIYKKEIIDLYDIKYPTKYHSHDDTIFNFMYLSAISTVYGINKKLYNYIIGNPNSLMGKIKSSKNPKSKYDFLLVWQDYLDFLKNISNQEIISYCLEFMISMINYFYSELDKREKKVFKIKFFEFKRKNKKFKEVLLKAEKFLFKDDNTLIQKIFSIKNSNNKTHKIVAILGVKLKFKRKREKNEKIICNNNML